MTKDASRNDSQAQQEPAGTGDKKGLPGFEIFGDAASHGAQRMQLAMDELARMNTVTTQRARAATDELTKLVTDSLRYGLEISAEWRRAGLEMARRTTEALGPRS